jgi:hypothetical protein
MSKDFASKVTRAKEAFPFTWEMVESSRAIKN